MLHWTVRIVGHNFWVFGRGGNGNTNGRSFYIFSRRAARICLCTVATILYVTFPAGKGCKLVPQCKAWDAFHESHLMGNFFRPRRYLLQVENREANSLLCMWHPYIQSSPCMARLFQHWRRLLTFTFGALRVSPLV